MFSFDRDPCFKAPAVLTKTFRLGVSAVSKTWATCFVLHQRSINLFRPGRLLELGIWAACFMALLCSTKILWDGTPPVSGLCKIFLRMQLFSTRIFASGAVRYQRISLSLKLHVKQFLEHLIYSILKHLLSNIFWGIYFLHQLFNSLTCLLTATC